MYLGYLGRDVRLAGTTFEACLISGRGSNLHVCCYMCTGFLQVLLFWPLLGEIIQFDGYLYNGLKPPTSTEIIYSPYVSPYVYATILYASIFVCIESRVYRCFLVSMRMTPAFQAILPPHKKGKHDFVVPRYLSSILLYTPTKSKR